MKKEKYYGFRQALIGGVFVATFFAAFFFVMQVLSFQYSWIKAVQTNYWSNQSIETAHRICGNEFWINTIELSWGCGHRNVNQ